MSYTRIVWNKVVCNWIPIYYNSSVNKWYNFCLLPLDWQKYFAQNLPNCGTLLQARLWVQVIHELRHGVKLKKVDYSRTPIEYELTPYEILMDDIRSRRYKLNKVMVDGDIPHRIKKDAHAIILEFIRSRPPLRKVRGIFICFKYSRTRLWRHERDWMFGFVKNECHFIRVV